MLTDFKPSKPPADRPFRPEAHTPLPRSMAGGWAVGSRCATPAAFAATFLDLEGPSTSGRLFVAFALTHLHRADDLRCGTRVLNLVKLEAEPSRLCRAPLYLRVMAFLLLLGQEESSFCDCSLSPSNCILKRLCILAKVVWWQIVFCK